MATKVADVLVEFNAEDKDLKQAAKNATTSLNNLGTQGSKSSGKVSAGFKVAAGAMAGLAVAGTTALTGLVAEATKLYSELEQNMGGVEAVFGDGYDFIKGKATEAYKNMGLSASDYMATANKMGSLFQGSGIDQTTAMNMTTEAMQRAADVASVMGIDMEAAMESVAGAAKGNFTMMDNLGVAMNATSIEAYALEKGINFTWNTASQAEKSEIAMKMFMDRTQQYAGNFAKESEQTISGSIGMMQGAWQNLMAGFANPDQSGLDGLVTSFVESLSTVASNILPVVQQVLSSIGTALPGLVTQLLPILTEVLTSIVTMITTVLPTLIPLLVQAAVSLFMALVNALPQIIPALIAGVNALITAVIEILPTIIPTLLEAAVQLFMALVDALPTIIDALVTAIPTVIDAVITLLPTLLPQLLAAAVKLFMALVDALPQIITALVGAIPTVVQSVITMLPTLIPQLLAGAVQLFMALVQAVPQILGSLLSAVGSLIGQIPSAIINGASALLNAGKQMMQGLINGIAGMAGQILDAILGPIKGAADAVLNFLGIASPSKLFEGMGINTGKGLIKGLASTAKDAAKAVAVLASDVATAAGKGLSKVGKMASSAMSGKTKLGSMNASLNIVEQKELEALARRRDADRLAEIEAEKARQRDMEKSRLRQRDQALIGQIIVPEGADPMAFAQQIGQRVRFA